MPLVQRVFEHRRAGALRLAHHRAELRDDAERVALGDEALELGELVLEPLAVDRGAAARMIFGCVVGPTSSPSFHSSSCSFSPARAPTNAIGICSSVRPESSIICRARSTIFTGSPMSRT